MAKAYRSNTKCFHDDVSVWKSKTADENQKIALVQSQQNFGVERTLFKKE